MARVLIVNMPFSNLRWPNLGPSLLKAALARQGIGCDIAYLNFNFAERVGLEHYVWLADFFAFVLGGERLFAKHFFDGLLNDGGYWRDVLLAADAGLNERDRRDFEATVEQIGPFLDQCMECVDWSQYAIVGFAASFQQTMPSMCLARRIKRLRPDVKIALGGAACEGPMGVELLRQFPLVDYVFLGEADLTFPAVVAQVLAGGRVDLPPGVAGRDAWGRLPTCQGESTETRQVENLPHGRQVENLSYVRDLDRLPYPDFDDYFARWEASPLRSEVEPLLFYETSRGCWWGQKHHCLFCGLNGATIDFRSKSPARAVAELKHLVGRYGVRRACSADNILDYRYYDTFLPMLRQAELGLGFVYEMKTNLTRRHVEALLDAGLGAAQLGIETFSTPVLRQIGKGATAVQNLQTLKWFSEAGIEVKWNLLYGFPGEDPAEYARLAELLPALVHLHPPLAVGRVRLDRFSPYFADPARYGMKDPRPNRAFRYVYPFPADSLARLAYYWEYDYADGRNVLDYAAPVMAACETWQQLRGAVTLRQFDREDGVLILSDTRPCATAFQHRLAGLDRAIYLFCDTGQALSRIAEFAAAHSCGRPADPSSLRHTLDRLVADRLMVYLDDRYLSLALRPPDSRSSCPGGAVEASAVESRQRRD